MGIRVGVAGASGYAGGELLRLLLGHPEFELGPLSAGASAGGRVADTHPQLAAVSDTRFVATEAGIFADADVVFLALPHGESAPLAAELPTGTVVVDLGADHRLADAAAWQAWYGGPHAGSWLYGLPELLDRRAALAGARRIANPGCYPTSVALGLAPLLAAGLVAARDVVVVAASGTSGAGRKAAPHLLGSEVMGAVSAYQVGGSHRHIPEMEQSLSEAAGTTVTLSFTPLLAPMPRGILATCTAPLASGAGVTSAELRTALLDAYAGEPFVAVLPDGRWPTTAATLGSNAAPLQGAADTRAGRATVVVAIDNLGKGAAGQAVQNANLALGLAETAGLSAVGVAP